MTTLKDIQNGLARLPLRGQFAFATICAERRYRDTVLYYQTFGTAAIDDLPQLRVALNECWHRRASGDITYDEKARAFHESVCEIIPDADDMSRRDDDVVLSRTAYSIAEAFMILREPANAAKLASLAGSEVLYLRENLYWKGNSIVAKEYAWQAHAISLLEGMDSMPITKDMLSRVGEYMVGEMLAWE